MRKIFTLVAAASIACAANAQTVETYSPYNEDGTLKENLVADPDPAKMTVVDISTASVKAELTSGPIAGYDNGQTLPLVAKYGNAIKQGQAPGSKNNPAVKMYPDTTKLLFSYVQGEGNPANLEKIDFEKIMTEGEWTGDYRANWDNAYYVADGSAGLPKNGTYMTFTPAVDGDLDVFVWSNKGNRYTFVVKGSDMKAIPYNSPELTASGWIASDKYTEEDGADFAGFPKYQEVLPLKAELLIAENKEADVKPNDYYCFGPGNQIALAHLKLKAKAGETYWVFQHSSQIGLINYSFTATGNVGLSTIAVDENAPVEYYNLQGVRIANPEHGLYIKRQGNKVTKVIL